MSSWERLPQLMTSVSKAVPSSNWCGPRAAVRLEIDHRHLWVTRKRPCTIVPSLQIKSGSVMVASRFTHFPAMLSQNLNSDVLMMESTEDWYRRDGAELLRTPKIRCVLVQRKMRADLIVIGSVLLQNATQLRFVEHD